LVGTDAWIILPLLPIAFCSFYLSLRRKNSATKEGILVYGAAMFLSFYLIASTVGYERGEPQPLIALWIGELVVLAAFAAIIITWILTYMGAVEKTMTKKIMLPIVAIFVAVGILVNPTDIPYIICYILMVSLFAVTAIRGTEHPIKVSK
jgi:hypothetical protein